MIFYMTLPSFATYFTIITYRMKENAYSETNLNNDEIQKAISEKKPTSTLRYRVSPFHSFRV